MLRPGEFGLLVTLDVPEAELARRRGSSAASAALFPPIRQAHEDCDFLETGFSRPTGEPANF